MTKHATFSGKPASQMPGELSGFIGLLRDYQVMSYLEIGARDGDTFHAVMTSLPKGSIGVAVDYPGGPWGNNRSAPLLDAAAADLRRKGYRIEVIIGESQSSQTHAKVLSVIGALMGGALFDAVFIDADHRYEPVKADYARWSEVAHIVALHDIAGHGVMQKSSGIPVEVPRFWAEVKQTRGHLEIVDRDSKMGIGVLL